MKPLTSIYWIRAGLGLVAGVLCAIYIYFSHPSELASLYTLFTGVALALVFYIITYYLVKLKYYARVEKQQKLMTQGIGVYFFAWIVSWTLIVTLLLPSVTVSIYSNTSLVDEREFWIALRGINGGAVIQNVSTMAGVAELTLLPPGDYTVQLGGNLTGYSVSNRNKSLTLDWMQNSYVNFTLELVE